MLTLPSFLKFISPDASQNTAHPQTKDVKSLSFRQKVAGTAFLILSFLGLVYLQTSSQGKSLPKEDYTRFEDRVFDLTEKLSQCQKDTSHLEKRVSTIENHSLFLDEISDLKERVSKIEFRSPEKSMERAALYAQKNPLLPVSGTIFGLLKKLYSAHPFLHASVLAPILISSGLAERLTRPDYNNLPQSFRIMPAFPVRA